MQDTRTIEEFTEELLPWIASSTDVIEHREYEKLSASVVYRHGLCQIERVRVRPGAIVLAHRHPNIDAIEVHVSGDLIFLVNSDPTRLNSVLNRARPIVDATLKRLRRHFRVRPTDWHGAKVGTTGAEFYSFQKWTGEVPMTAAGVDWEGAPLDS